MSLRSRRRRRQAKRAKALARDRRAFILAAECIGAAVGLPAMPAAVTRWAWRGKRRQRRRALRAWGLIDPLVDPLTEAEAAAQAILSRGQPAFHAVLPQLAAIDDYMRDAFESRRLLLEIRRRVGRSVGLPPGLLP